MKVYEIKHRPTAKDLEDKLGIKVAAVRRRGGKTFIEVEQESPETLDKLNRLYPHQQIITHSTKSIIRKVNPIVDKNHLYKNLPIKRQQRYLRNEKQSLDQVETYLAAKGSAMGEQKRSLMQNQIALRRSRLSERGKAVADRLLALRLEDPARRPE